jgi:hypothetical protein
MAPRVEKWIASSLSLLATTMKIRVLLEIPGSMLCIAPG